VHLFGHGKLRSKWDGPFKVVAVAPHGVVTQESDDGKLFKVNGERLNVYFEYEKEEAREIDVVAFRDLEHCACFLNASNLGP
jgi:hypothetical protein